MNILEFVINQIFIVYPCFQADGSCVAFDLQEASSKFPSTLPWPETTNDYCLRTAAYDTSFSGVVWKSGKNEEQDAPIVDIHTVGDWENE